MNSSVSTKRLAQVETPLLAVALATGSDLPAALTELDRAAGGVLAVIPPLVLAFLFQRLIVRGLVSGAVKG